MAQYLTPCRWCGQLIAWDKTKTGKNMPLDPDGRNHFVRCKRGGKVAGKEVQT